MKIKHCNKNKGYLLIELFYSGDTGYFGGSGPVKFPRHNQDTIESNITNSQAKLFMTTLN